MILASLAWAAIGARPDSLGSVESATVAVRCHWQRAEDESRCADVLVWAEAAWVAQVDGLGFRAPPSDGVRGGSAALDIYLTLDWTSGAGEAWVDCVGGDGTCEDTDPTDGVASAASFVVIDARTDDADLPGYVAHEFNHTCQYATDYAEPYLDLWEGTAVAAQRWTLPDEPLSADELADFQATPWISTVLQDGYFLEELGYWSWYEYGAGVWVLWLDQRWTGGSGAIGPALWEAVTQEGYGDEPDVLDAWDAVAGDWREDLLAFSADRARFGGGYAPAWLDWGAGGGQAWREATELGASETLSPEFPPYPLGVSYYDAVVPAGATRTITVAGDETVDWGLVVVDGADTWTAVNEALTFTAAADTTITVGVVNLGAPELDADDPLAPAEFTITLRDPDAEDGGEDDGEDSGVPPSDGSCGCASGRAPVAAWALGLVLLARRRR